MHFSLNETTTECVFLSCLIFHNNQVHTPNDATQKLSDPTIFAVAASYIKYECTEKLITRQKVNTVTAYTKHLMFNIKLEITL